MRFDIVEAFTGRVVDTHYGTWHAADRLAHWFTATTGKLHLVRAVKP